MQQHNIFIEPHITPIHSPHWDNFEGQRYMKNRNKNEGGITRSVSCPLLLEGYSSQNFQWTLEYHWL